jgi:hypothetical protein
MTSGMAKVYHARFSGENVSMSYENLFVILFGIGVAGTIIYWLAYQTGRLHGYRHGLEKGTTLTSRVQHLKGMSDGYVMAIQHTPGQRNEYMNNVLLKMGSITQADVEADRQRRRQLQG